MVQENTKTEVTEVKGSLTYEDKVIQKIREVVSKLGRSF